MPDGEEEQQQQTTTTTTNFLMKVKGKVKKLA